MINKLLHGDCLELMKQIPDGSIDAIITDPPYGTTACKWDSVIPFDLMWQQLNRIIKPNGAIVLFGSEPFSSALRMSNIKNYKYDWIWEKSRPANFMNAKIQPMKYHENILIFSNKKHNYYPIKFKGNKNHASKPRNGKSNIYNIENNKNGIDVSDIKNPKSIISIKSTDSTKNLHPTQKPIALMQYLIKTYTNENETVLDFTMGSGSTGVACKNLNRKFIGIEMDDKYFEIAKNRIEKE
jgi:site-specific DNA-methyltransferase (adenine-specific)